MFIPFKYNTIKNCDPEIKKLQYKVSRSINKKDWDAADNLKTIAQQLSFIKGYIDWQGDNRVGPVSGINGDVIECISAIIETVVTRDTSDSEDLYALLLMPALDQIILNVSMMHNDPLANTTFSHSKVVREENIKAFKTLKAIFTARLSLGYGSFWREYITAKDLALLARQNSYKSIKYAISVNKLETAGGRGGLQKITSNSAREWLATSIKNRLTLIKTKKQLHDLNSMIGLGEFNDFKASQHLTYSTRHPRAMNDSHKGWGVYLFLDMSTNKVLFIGRSADIEPRIYQHLGRFLRLGNTNDIKLVTFSAQAMNSSISQKQCMQLEEFLKTSQIDKEIEQEQIKDQIQREVFMESMSLSNATKNSPKGRAKPNLMDPLLEDSNGFAYFAERWGCDVGDILIFAKEFGIEHTYIGMNSYIVIGHFEGKAIAVYPSNHSISLDALPACDLSLLKSNATINSQVLISFSQIKVHESLKGYLPPIEDLKKDFNAADVSAQLPMVVLESSAKDEFLLIAGKSTMETAYSLGHRDFPCLVLSEKVQSDLRRNEEKISEQIKSQRKTREDKKRDLKALKNTLIP